MAGLSINEMTTFRWSFDEDVARYRDAGIGAIGIWRQKLADFGEDRGIELVARSGLAVSNLLWAGGFTGSDGHSHQESLDDAAEAIRLAAALNCRHLVVYSGARNGHTLSHARRLFVSALHNLLPLAEDHDVMLAVEPMHAGCAAEWTFLTSLDDCLSLVDCMNSRHLKLAFDTYHMGYDPAIIERLAQIAPRIGIVHLADGLVAPKREQSRCPLGLGRLPLGCMLQALKAAGYEGYYDVELVGEAIECCDYAELLRDSKRAYENMVGAARHEPLAAVRPA